MTSIARAEKRNLAPEEDRVWRRHVEIAWSEAKRIHLNNSAFFALVVGELLEPAPVPFISQNFLWVVGHTFYEGKWGLVYGPKGSGKSSFLVTCAEKLSAFADRYFSLDEITRQEARAEYQSLVRTGGSVHKNWQLRNGLGFRNAEDYRILTNIKFEPTPRTAKWVYVSTLGQLLLALHEDYDGKAVYFWGIIDEFGHILPAQRSASNEFQSVAHFLDLSRHFNFGPIFGTQNTSQLPERFWGEVDWFVWKDDRDNSMASFDVHGLPRMQNQRVHQIPDHIVQYSQSQTSPLTVDIDMRWLLSGIAKLEKKYEELDEPVPKSAVVGLIRESVDLFVKIREGQVAKDEVLSEKWINEREKMRAQKMAGPVEVQVPSIRRRRKKESFPETDTRGILE